MVRQNYRCTTAPSNKKWAAAAIFSSIFFFLAGQPFIPLLGLQNDEALFAGPLYEPLDAIYSWRFGEHHQLPIMLMSYLGCLKTLLYAPVLRAFGNSVYAVREPALLIGAGSIFLFYLLLRDIAGFRAGIIGCWLLAADSLYLLTSCYDWGPVALQHLLVIGGAYAVFRFYQNGSDSALAAGFFLFGLALWDKALALWILSGLTVAALAFYPRQLLGAVRLRSALLSAGCLVIGALPLISYNLEKPLATIRENTVFSTNYLLRRLVYLERTARGGILLGFLNADDSLTPAPHPPHGLLESASANTSSAFDHPSSSLLLAAFLVALALAPAGGWETVRTVAFFVTAMVIAWVQMAGNPNTGGSVHHVILLWPWPQAVIAISFAAASTRWKRWGGAAAATATGVIVFSCVLLTNEYFAKLVRNGGTTPWTTAVYPLARTVGRSGADFVFCTDWGILSSLTELTRNRPALRNGIDLPDRTMEDAVADPRAIFVGHAPGAEILGGSDEKISEAAHRRGKTREFLGGIDDEFGRREFVIYGFR